MDEMASRNHSATIYKMMEMVTTLAVHENSPDQHSETTLSIKWITNMLLIKWTIFLGSLL